MPPTESLARFHDTGRTRWKNWHENVDQRVTKLFDVWNADPNRSTLGGYNDTTRGIQRVIREAIDHDRTVRAVGGGWSFSPVAATSGVLLNTRPLNYRFPIDAVQSHPQYPGRGNVVFLQCGNSIATLNTYLASKGLALRTAGASNGQTIAGALSTGTHGAGVEVGAVQDYVVGLHVITGPGRSVWLERQSYPVANDALAGYVLADLVRDDELFHAALVSFGNFGIIHGVLIEADPLFYLHAWRKRLFLDNPLWTALENLSTTNYSFPGSNGRRPYHLQILINPYEAQEMAFLTVMYREATRPPGSTQANPFSKIAQGDGALEVLARLTDLVPEITTGLTELLTKLGYQEFENIAGTPGETFKDTTTRGHAASAAMGIPLDRIRQAVAICRAQVVAAEAPALVALRFVRASPATLAFTRHAPVTCVLEVDGPDSNRVRDAYRRIWAALDAAGLPYTFHWGKLSNLDRTSVRRMYAEAGSSRVDRWVAARHTLLPTPELRRAFANDFSTNLDLCD